MSDEPVVDDVVRHVNRALVRVDDRQGLEQAVVDILADSERYVFAWIGRYDAASGAVEPVAHAGAEADDLERLTVTADPDDAHGQGPAGQAIRSGEVVVNDVAADRAFEPWRDGALSREYRATATVPLTGGDKVVGVLAVYADRPDAFADVERQQLAEIGSNVGLAVAARERERELERYRMLVEAVGDPMYVLDADGHFEMANEAMAAKVGRDRDGLLGMHVSTFMPEEDVERGSELLVELAQDPDRRWGSFEMDLLPAEDERAHSENRVAALTDEQGRLTGSVGVIRDITERVRERERLRDLTDRVQRLHGVATALQTATDPETVYELGVDAGEEILGFDWCVVAIVSEEWFELAAVSEAAPVDVGERHVRVSEGLAGAAFQQGESVLESDGHAGEPSAPVGESFGGSIAVPLGDVGVLQANAGDLDQFDGRDVELAELLSAHLGEALGRIERERELRERERELARQNERLEQFASAISHDLRNPLNLADGHLDLARDHLAGAAVRDPAVDEHLGEVDWALDRIERLVDDVLTLARQGQTPEDTAPVAVADVAADAWATVVDARSDLVVAADPGTVEADRDRLQRLLENLFANAVEHAGPAPRVTIGPTEAGFYVADDGPGIPVDERDQVFASGYTTAEAGTGFGLAIVRELAEAHGWSVRVGESATGGAQFEFTGIDVLD